MRKVFRVLVCLLAAGCATSSTIESRRAEKLAAFRALPAAEQEMVNEGRIKVGMNQECVYIAWGAPAEVLESEDESGHKTIWRYHGTVMQETRYWAYREVPGRANELVLERYLLSDYNPRDYVRAEIVFQDGKVFSWRTLPRPTN